VKPTGRVTRQRLQDVVDDLPTLEAAARRMLARSA